MLLVDAEDPGRRHAHRGERLVDLPQVDVADRRGRRGRAPSGWRRSGARPVRSGAHADRRPGPHDGERLEALRPRPARRSATTMAAAPSLTPAGVAGGDAEALDLGVQRLERRELLHASCRGAGARRRRRCAVAPSRPVTSIGTISSAKLPASMAATARWCERSAQASISSRVTPASTAAFQPTVIDMSMFGRVGRVAVGRRHPVGPSRRCPGTRRVDRGDGRRSSATPPATTTRSMPARIDAGGGRDRGEAGRRSGGCGPRRGRARARPRWRRSGRCRRRRRATRRARRRRRARGRRPDRRTASATTWVPSSNASTSTSEPLNAVPIAVRAVDTMTASVIAFPLSCLLGDLGGMPRRLCPPSRVNHILALRERRCNLRQRRSEVVPNGRPNST